MHVYKTNINFELSIFTFELKLIIANSSVNIVNDE